MLESLVSLSVVADGSLQLAHEIPFAGFLLASHLMAYHLAEIRDGSGCLALVDIIVGIGVVPFLLGSPVDGITLHIAYHVFCIVSEILLDIAFGKPCTSLAVDGWLGGIETAHVRESGGCRLEIALEELASAHQHPCLPEEWIILSAAEPLDVLGCLASVLGPLGASLDAMLVDGFLALLYGTVKLALAQLAAVLIAHGVEGNLLGVIVLVAILLFE